MTEPLNPNPHFPPLDFGYHDVNEGVFPARDPLDVPNRLPQNVIDYYNRPRTANTPAVGRFALTGDGNESPRWRAAPNE